jgi:uncharacterized RDD family membrane protein YckC
MNEDGARFCNQCGAALEQTCPKCGASNAPGSIFYKGCGQVLSSAYPESEQVSAEPERDPQVNKVCSGCRTINEASAVYCYKCGVTLPAKTLASAETIGNPAGFWIRAAAYAIDNIIIAILGVLVSVILTGAEASEAWSQASWVSFGPAPIISEGLAVAYFTYNTGKWGQTLGKAWLGLKVVRQDGSGLTYWRSFGRYWAYYLSTIPLLLGFIMIALTSHKRGLHDYVSDTRVIRLIR